MHKLRQSGGTYGETPSDLEVAMKAQDIKIVIISLVVMAIVGVTFLAAAVAVFFVGYDEIESETFCLTGKMVVLLAFMSGTTFMLVYVYARKAGFFSKPFARLIGEEDELEEPSQP